MLRLKHSPDNNWTRYGDLSLSGASGDGPAGLWPNVTIYRAIEKGHRQRKTVTSVEGIRGPSTVCQRHWHRHWVSSTLAYSLTMLPRPRPRATATA